MQGGALDVRRESASADKGGKGGRKCGLQALTSTVGSDCMSGVKEVV